MAGSHRDTAASGPEAAQVAIARCSPFLGAIAAGEAEWLASALTRDSDSVLAELTGPIRSDETDLHGHLRVLKRRLAYVLAYHDLVRGMEVMEVTGWLSRFAEICLSTGLSALIAAEVRRGKLPEAARYNDGGMIVLAMGKLGARELNYSSDIDLIVLFDPEVLGRENADEHRAVFIRITQKLVRLLSENSANGYVFRTDLRLRPDPSVTPVCLSVDAAERYYESLGRTWERAAMIKARPVAGNTAAGAAFLDRLVPFVWRRHLDFAAIQDAQDMLLKIRDHKGLSGDIRFPGHDIKLGRGGIREIEFFAQTHQLIFGGRDPSLRSSGTIDALLALATSGRISDDRATCLIDNYRFLRTLEHRLQMLDDAQTHVLPANAEKIERLAAFCGFKSSDDLEKTVLERLAMTHGMTELMHSEASRPVSRDQDVDALLTEMEDAWTRRPALRTSRARQIYARIRPRLVSSFANAADTKAALTQFDGFVKGLPAGVQLFSLFEANGRLLDLVVDICSTAPALSEYLGRNPSVLDVVLDAEFYEPLPDLQWYIADLGQRLEGASDYETVLDLLRVWQKEQHFRVGVHLLRGLSDPKHISGAYSAIAESSLSHLVPLVEAHVAERYGRIENQQVAVLAMGKLGSRAMTADSDLDLIVIYDAPADGVSNGARQIPVTQYFARLTQALVSAMTVPTAQGRLYEVDMRLRPSGRQGPVATSLDGFRSYQQNSAWTWEHLALTRARVVAGSADLASSLTRCIAGLLGRSRKQEQVLSDVRDMRARLDDAHKAEADAAWETKFGPGRLMDIELFVQAGSLITGLQPATSFDDQIMELVASGWLDTTDGSVLVQCQRLLVLVQHAARLIGPNFEPEKGNSAQWQVLARLTQQPDAEALRQRLAENAQSACGIIDAYLTRV